MHGQGSESACAHAVRHASFEEEFARLIDVSHVLADEIVRGQRAVRAAAESLAARLPPIRSATEFRLVRSVLVEFSARLFQEAQPPQPASILRLIMLPAPTAVEICCACRLGEGLIDCLSALNGCVSRARRESIQTLRSVRALAVIRSRCCDRSITAESVASSVGVSREYLAKLLHVHQGCGFRAALRLARREVARSLLERSLVSMKEIAVRSGYSSTSQLDRDFRRRYAVTPGEYRRRRFAAAPSGGLAFDVVNGIRVRG